MTSALRVLFPAYFADYWGHSAEYGALRDALEAWQAPMRGVEPQPFDVRDQLSTVTIQTLIISGAHDFICGPKWAAMLRAALPHAAVLELPDSGHFAHIEQPDDFVPAVLKLMNV